MNVPVVEILIFFQGEEIKVHPWYLMLPAAISCSFAFMLPVATPPNAIIFGGGHLKVKDMVCIVRNEGGFQLTIEIVKDLMCLPRDVINWFIGFASVCLHCFGSVMPCFVFG